MKLTPNQMFFLLAVAINVLERMTPAMLSDHLPVTINNDLALMVEKGLIMQNSSTPERKTYDFSITAKGRALLDGWSETEMHQVWKCKV